MALVVALFLITTTLATAATIHLRFNERLFQNETLNATATAYPSIYQRYYENKTYPTIVVDGFKLRGEEFFLAGQEFYRTYTDNQTGQNVTIFELWSWRDSQVDARTATLQGLLTQKEQELEVQKNETATAKQQSFPALAQGFQLLGLAVVLIVSFYLLINFLRKYQDKNSQNYSMQWSPEMEKGKTYEDEIKEAFERVERGGFEYD